MRNLSELDGLTRLTGGMNWIVDGCPTLPLPITPPEMVYMEMAEKVKMEMTKMEITMMEMEMAKMGCNPSDLLQQRIGGNFRKRIIKRTQF